MVLQRQGYKNGPRDSRHRIEHIELLHPSDLHRFKELGVIASMQPLHCTRPEVNHFEAWLEFIGKERYAYGFPWQDLRGGWGKTCFWQRLAVVSMNPFLGFDAALNRQPWAMWLKSQAQSLHDTLAAYTCDAAYGEFQENQKGQLKEGMWADVVLLSENIFAVSRCDIKDLEAHLTICDGEIVYEKV
ncbi:MAG: amidohydrolase family protein [Deinococcales bacterium]